MRTREEFERTDAIYKQYADSPLVEVEFDVTLSSLTHHYYVVGTVFAEDGMKMRKQLNVAHDKKAGKGIDKAKTFIRRYLSSWVNAWNAGERWEDKGTSV